MPCSGLSRQRASARSCRPQRQRPMQDPQVASKSHSASDAGFSPFLLKVASLGSASTAVRRRLVAAAATLAWAAAAMVADGLPCDSITGMMHRNLRPSCCAMEWIYRGLGGVGVGVGVRAQRRRMMCGGQSHLAL